MRIRLGDLRRIIRESLGGSSPEESYSIELLDDPSFDQDSVYVPNDVKRKIRKWAKDMKIWSG